MDLVARKLIFKDNQAIGLTAPVVGRVYAAIGMVAAGCGSTPSLPTVEALWDTLEDHLQSELSQPPAAAQLKRVGESSQQPAVQEEAKVVKD